MKSEGGRFESLGIPVRVGGLMGCIVGPNGHGGEALYFNINQAGAPLFLGQIDPGTGEAHQFNAPQGPGAWATAKEAKFFAFDPKQKRKVFEAVLVPGAANYPATMAADGKVFTTVGTQLFVFDPQAMRVVKTISLPGSHAQISLGQHRGGSLVGLTGGAVYVVDPSKGEVVHTAPAPAHVGCGFALTGDAVYFGSGPTLWRDRLPALEAFAQPERKER
jgi:outer membrane protein assembly factor BamB